MDWLQEKSAESCCVLDAKVSARHKSSWPRIEDLLKAGFFLILNWLFDIFIVIL